LQLDFSIKSVLNDEKLFYVICLARAICYRPSVCLSVRHTGGSVTNGWSYDSTIP